MLALGMPFLVASFLRWYGVPINFVGVAFGVAGGVAQGVAFGVAGFGVAFGVAFLRLDTVLLSIFPALAQSSQHLAILLQRVSPLPLVRLRGRLQQQLRANWA